MAHSVRRIARSNTTKLNAYAGPAGELVMDTTARELVLQTGSAGGVRMATKGDINILNNRIENIAGGGGASGGSVTSVADYGAKGDGVTDDTAAFEAAQAAAKGYGVYVPAGKYNLSRKVDGFFWSDTNVVIPYTRVWCRGYYDFVPNDFCGGAVSSIGGDNPNISGLEYGESDRASQAPCCDIFDSILYIPQQTSSNGASWIKVVKWAETESARVTLAQSTANFGLTGHQGLNIYRPTKADKPVFIISRSRYTAANVKDYGRAFMIGFYSYDYKTQQSPVEDQVVYAFTSADVSTWGVVYERTIDGELREQLMDVAVSPDGAILVASAWNSSGKRVNRVWDLHAFMMGKYTAANFAANALYTWTEPAKSETTGGQGVWTDGRYIYQMSTASAKASFETNAILACLIGVWTLDGHFLGYNMIDTTYAAKVYDGHNSTNGSRGNAFLGKRTLCEFEGMFLAPWQGKLVPVLLTSFMRYDTDGSTVHKRFNRYAIPSESRVSSMIQSVRHLILEGDVYATMVNSFNNSNQDLMTQSILSYAPTGANDVNVCLGGQGGTYICGGEVATRIRERFVEMSLAGTTFGPERVQLLADGTICLHAGCNDQASTANTGSYFLQETGAISGFHINGAQNFFFRNTEPLIDLQYTDYVKGTTPSADHYSRIAWAGEDPNHGLTANTNFNLAALQHNIYANNATYWQRFFIAIHDLTESGGNSYITALSAGQLKTAVNGSNYVNSMQAHLWPWNGNAFDLGVSSHRWRMIYLQNQPDVGSDVRDKQQVDLLSDAEKRVATKCKALIRRFKLNDDVDQHGADAVTHFGVVAQDVKEAFESEGLDALKYNVVRYSELDSKYSICYGELLCFIIAAL